MKHTVLGCLTLAGLAGMLPTDGYAQMFVPAGHANCTISQTRPVVTTQLRPQQVTAYCEVTETQVTQKQVVENIPVTTCKNVTVDEGSFQSVWVPKPVTKQVAQTMIQQRVKTVSVPVQVKRRVPSTVTQMVPVQSVQYVTEQVPVQATAMASSCDTCGGGGMAFAPTASFQTGFLPPTYQPQAFQPTPLMSSAVIPSMPAINVPMSQTAMSASTGSRLETVRSRVSSYDSDSDSYETVRARGVPVPRDESISPPRRASSFSGVPSAASVWQSRGSR